MAKLTNKTLTLKTRHGTDLVLQFHDKFGSVYIVVRPKNTLSAKFLKELRKFMIAKVSEQDIYDSMKSEENMDDRKFLAMLKSKGWKPPVDKKKLKQSQNMLKWIDDQINKGNNVLVQTHRQIITWTPKNYKKFKDQGIEPFKIASDGDLMMARGRNYDRIPLDVVKISSHVT